MGIFRDLLVFDEEHVMSAPSTPGVYIIYGSPSIPVYVGRSRSNIKDRLSRHVSGRGNYVIADLLALSQPLWFEYSEMLSPEQAEAQLIKRLGTEKYANLKKESDPADL